MPEQINVPPTAISEVTEWTPWFAWHPVRLYMTGRTAWLSWMFRRCVIHATGFRTCDYTTEPDEFPLAAPKDNKAA